MHFNVGFGGAAGFGVPLPVAGGIPSTGNDTFVGVAGLVTGTPIAPAAEFCCASDDVTVVLDTCLDPDDLLPLVEPNFSMKFLLEL